MKIPINFDPKPIQLGGDFCKVSHLAAPCKTVFDGSVLSGICHHQIVGLHTVTPVTHPCSLTWNPVHEPLEHGENSFGKHHFEVPFFLGGRGGYFSGIIDNPEV